MGSTARLAEEFHSHFTEYAKFDGHAELSVRLMRRELPQNHWVGYEGLGFDVCDTRLRSLTVALPDDKTRGKVCTKHAKYGFYSFNLPECVDECLNSKGRVRERTERVLVRAFNNKVLMDLCALHELVAAERHYRGEHERAENHMFLRYCGMERQAATQQATSLEEQRRAEAERDTLQQQQMGYDEEGAKSKRRRKRAGRKH